METLKIYTLTWNTNAQYAPDDMNCQKLLGLEEMASSEIPDIFCLGFQELSIRPDNYLLDSFFYAEDTWSRSCRTILDPLGYIKIRSQRLLGMAINVFVKKDHILHVRDIEDQYVRFNVKEAGLKGGVSVRFKIYGVSLCFVNTHLCAHDHLLQERIDGYNQIIDTMDFKQDETPKILYHDYIFWMGDLNFRIEENSFNVDEIVESVEKGEFSKLLAKDQLLRVQKEDKAFQELSEKLPTFPPTYKFKIGTVEYDKKRRPAWTDRILYRVNSYNYEDANIELSLDAFNYQCHNDEMYRNSDHFPVSQEFKISIFGKELGKQKRVDAYGPPIRFHHFDEPWYVNEDRQVCYDIETNAGRLLGPNDWIGLFKENFSALDDYRGYAWASSSRRTDEMKKIWIPDTVVTLTGRFVLVYVSAKNSIMGMSDPFDVIYRYGDEVEVAEEVGEHLHID